jgi:hypothetical protein
MDFCNVDVASFDQSTPSAVVSAKVDPKPNLSASFGVHLFAPVTAALQACSRSACNLIISRVISL